MRSETKNFTLGRKIFAHFWFQGRRVSLRLHFLVHNSKVKYIWLCTDQVDIFWEAHKNVTKFPIWFSSTLRFRHIFKAFNPEFCNTLFVTSNHQTTNLVFPNFFHEFFSVFAVEKITFYWFKTGCFLSVGPMKKLFQLIKLRTNCGNNWVLWWFDVMNKIQNKLLYQHFYVYFDINQKLLAG